jgi:hypothetical protein
MRNFFLSLWYKWKNYQYERKCIKYFGAKPEKIYLSQRDYDALVEKINTPDPEQIESLRKLMNRKSPWDEKQ